MDTAILVDELDQNAVQLIKVLDEKDFVFTIAALMKNEDAEDWRLVLGIPGIRTKGSRESLTQINNIIEENSLKISLYDIILVDDQDRLFTLLRDKVGIKSEITPLKITGNYFDGTRFPDSIIYQVK
jgi:hypothetical protein